MLLSFLDTGCDPQKGIDMSVFKRGVKWQYDFWVDGKRYRGSIPEARVKAQAERAENKIRDSVYEGTYGKKTISPKLRVFIAETFLPWAKTNKRTWAHDEFRSRPLIEAMGSKTMDEISPILIEKYKRDRRASKTYRGTQRAPSTVNRELELLSKIFSLAIDQGLAIQNPCQKVKRLREDNERNRYLSDEEETRLLGVLIGRRKSLRPLIVLAIHTGMRRGELLSLRWANVDFARGLIHVMNSHREQTKSGHSRSIPMNRIAREQLHSLQMESGNTEYVFVNRRTGEPLTDVKTGFRSACRDAGIDDFRFHDLRHTAATRLGDAGVDARRIMAILGHRCIQTSARYTHATDDGLRRAIEALVHRQKADRHSFPHNDEQRPLLAAVSH
jgi:integrase